MALTVGTNTYINEADAASYLTTFGISLSAAELSLKQATIALDRLFGSRFIGLKAQFSQPLYWPRIPTAEQQDTTSSWYLVDSFGEFRDFSGIPAEVKQATAELAVLIENDVDLYAQPQAKVSETSISVEGAVKESTKYTAGYASDPLYKIRLILAPILRNGPQLKLAR